ncbi:hypothetical protein ASG90_13065 [Nocardioides sp. Soil797]|nr:hypothetical protein ASG90_13065 [Nocardioides sp. Soil797]
MEPDFMVIGGQRCGTTSIFNALSEHPQIVRPPVEKGTDYYTLHYARGHDWYRAHFPVRSVARLRTRGQALAFEACTYYMFHPFALERIAQDHPDIKLVVMLRDPVERAFSAFKHEVARGFEPEHDFVTALELEDQRLIGEVEKMRDDISYESHPHRHQAYKSRGQFAEQLDRVHRLFARDQVHVMESESFFEQPEREYRDLLRFLELNADVMPTFGRHNARPSAPMPDDARSLLDGHFRSHDDALSDVLGRRPHWSR